MKVTLKDMLWLTASICVAMAASSHFYDKGHADGVTAEKESQRKQQIVQAEEDVMRRILKAQKIDELLSNYEQQIRKNKADDSSR